jgi:urease accessory protein
MLANGQHLVAKKVRFKRLGNDYRVHGKLDLSFSRRAQRTVLHVRAQRPPLQVVRAFDLPNAAALVHLHTVSGGVLGGDRLDLSVQLEANAQVQLTTTSATRVYKSREQAPPAFQSNQIQLDEGSLLEYLPDALIPFAGSRFQQETHITLSEGAGLFWWEVVAPGREARGERFAYELLELQTALYVGECPILREQTRLEPRLRSLDSSARLGHYRYMATFYICKAGEPVARWTALEKQLQQHTFDQTQVGSILWGVSMLPAHGLLVRALALRGRDIYPGLLRLWQVAKRELYGREAVLPRKIY